MIDATLMVCRDGSSWFEPHAMVATTIDSPPERYRIIEVRDGSDEPPPLITWVMPDRPAA